MKRKQNSALNVDAIATPEGRIIQVGDKLYICGSEFEVYDLTDDGKVFLVQPHTWQAMWSTAEELESLHPQPE